MEMYKVQLVETLISILVFLTLKLLLRYFIRLTILHSYFKNAERKDVLKLINLILFAVFCIILVSIWSVKQENILLVASSLLTVFGVALFAEMSILSNVTAFLILFFQHPLKIGDTLSITQDGKEIKGVLTDMTYFFVFIKTTGSEIITIPNAILLKHSFYVVRAEEGS